MRSSTKRLLLLLLVCLFLIVCGLHLSGAHDGQEASGLSLAVAAVVLVVSRVGPLRGLIGPHQLEPSTYSEFSAHSTNATPLTSIKSPLRC